MNRFRAKAMRPGVVAVCLASALSTSAMSACAIQQKESEYRYSTLPPKAQTCSYGPDKKLLKLDPGEHCFAHIVAAQRLSITPVQVVPGEHYQISVPPNQYWSDASQASTPPQGRNGNWIMNMVEDWKRVPKAKWFALIGTVHQNDVPADPVQLDQDISDNPKLVITQAGRLAFYPNDAITPWGADTFYKNNHGEIWIQISRTDQDGRADSQ